jgi:hypothetical protein
MNILQSSFRLLRRLFLYVLAAYWAIFIFYTAKKFATGGWPAVVGWYQHIDTKIDHQGQEWSITPWSWKTFLLREITALAITLVLLSFERRPAQHRSSD